jgi:hypothetical protein
MGDDGRAGHVPSQTEPGAFERLLALRDAALRDPDTRAELDAFCEGLRDTRPAEPVAWP